MRPRRSALAAAAALPALAAAGCGGSSGSLAPPRIGPAISEGGVAPPPGAVVDARRWGTRDLAVARKGETATVSVVGPQGDGVGGLSVRVDGRRATPCGRGCYRAPDAAGPVVVAVGGRTFRFDLPRTAPSGDALVEAATRAYARLGSVTLDQRLGSGRGAPLRTTFLFVAPDRLRYSIPRGSQAIVIGSRRWDRPSPAGRWTRSPQQRVRVMHPPWGRAVDAHVVAPHTVTFYDPSTRAWFRVVCDPRTSLPRTVLMTGISHFMVDRFSRFDAPAAIAPPRQ